VHDNFVFHPDHVPRCDGRTCKVKGLFVPL
jgi:hypothetical protein